MWRKKTGRLVRVFTPFFLLLVVLLVLNINVARMPFFQQATLPVAPPKVDQPAIGVANTPAPSVSDLDSIPTAIANATVMPTISPELTVESSPTLFPREMITLTGPPEESQFSLSAPLSFYWYSDKQLVEGESFKLFLVNDSIEKLVGTVSEPNMGSAFQVNFIPENSGISPGEYFWKVKVTAQEGNHILGESERRSITLVESEN